MYENINQQALDFGKQFTDNLVKAQSEGLKTLEKISNVQLKAVEAQAAANAAFVDQASKATDADSVRALWEKGADFSRESAEKNWATHKDVLELLAQNAETVGTLAQAQYDAGSAAANTAASTGKKAKK